MLTAAASVAFTALGFYASAEVYPSEPVRVVVPSSAGGASDVTARALARAAEEHLGQSVVIENMPGAGTALGSSAVANSQADGHTVLMMHEAAISADLQGRFAEGVDALMPIAVTGSEPYVIVVRADSPVATAADLAAVQAAPQTLRAAVNIGGFNHIASIIAGEAMGFEITPVQYSGGADALQALLGGHVELNFIVPGTVAPYVEAGELRVIAVMNTTRLDAFPDVPTMEEAGFAEATLALHHMWWVPAGTEAERVETLADALERAMADARTAEFFTERKADPVFMRGSGVQNLVESQRERLARILEVAGIL